MASNCDETVNQMRSTRQKEGMVEVIHIDIISIIIDKVGENESIENKKPKRDSHRAKRVYLTRTTQTRSNDDSARSYHCQQQNKTHAQTKDSTRQATKAAQETKRKHDGFSHPYHLQINMDKVEEGGGKGEEKGPSIHVRRLRRRKSPQRNVQKNTKDL
uniref:Uncharacterized protein n=2 Tax=Ditylum brightwellii TaxID=49249 RepID=A0A7S4VFW2_9STRA